MQRLCALFISALFMHLNIAYATSSPHTMQRIASSSVMSSQEFKSIVNTMGQQSQSNLSDQLSQSLSKKMPAAAPDNSATTRNTSPSQTVNPNNTATARPNPTRPSRQQTKQPDDTNPYTGFGTGSSSPSPPSDTNTGGGWNINY